MNISPEPTTEGGGDPAAPRTASEKFTAYTAPYDAKFSEGTVTFKAWREGDVIGFRITFAAWLLPFKDRHIEWDFILPVETVAGIVAAITPLIAEPEQSDFEKLMTWNAPRRACK